MTTNLNDLGKTLLAQLYQIVTGGDANVPPSKNTFLSWCQPGIPFQAKDFNFAAKGLGGGKDAEADRLLLQQAFDFAQIVDFVPDRTGIYNNDMQQTVYRTSEARLSHLYGEILRFSKVVSKDLTEKEKAKLDKFRGLLRTTKKVIDIVTDEEKEVTVDGPMLQAYSEKMAAYIMAAKEYNMKRVAAQSAVGPDGKLAVADWSNNASLYRLQVKAATDAWVSGGYRNEVNDVNAYINQVTQRSMRLWKDGLQEDYNGATVDAMGNGQVFKFTSVVPGNFANSAGWTGYSVYHDQVSTSSSAKSNSWSAGAGVNFGFWSVGGNANGFSSEYNSNYSLSKFKLSFELAQVIISRPWFYPEFFMNRGWTLRKGEGWNYDQMPSDGKIPPNGNLIAYPTSILFARNIKIESSEFVSAYKQYSSHVGGGASVGWGPFRLSGSYSHSDSGNRYDSTADGQSLTVPGMQIIGFVNHMIPQSPNPLPELKDAEFE
jgi:hypothetical protein